MNRKSTYIRGVQKYLLYLLLISFAFLFPQLSTAKVFEDSCTYKLQGVVLEAETQDPVAYAKITIKEIDKTTYTDTSGYFSFEGLCQSENTLICTCLGYCDTTCHNHHSHKNEIYLKTDVLELTDIIIEVEEEPEVGTKSIAQTHLDESQLSKLPTSTLAATLAEIEGVTLSSVGSNVQIPVIHGLRGNRVLILNNGVKHGFQNWGNDHAPEIDINSAHSIDLVKGAAGVRYGPEALGGAIIIKSAPLNLNQKFTADLGSGFETNGRGYNAKLKIKQGFKTFSYQVGGAFSKIGDRHAPDYFLTNSGKEEQDFNIGLRYHKGNWDIKTFYSFVNQNLGILRASISESGNLFIQSINNSEPLIIDDFSYEINEPNQLTQHHLAKTTIDWWYSDEAKLSLNVGTQLNKRQEFDVRRNADLPIIDLNLTTNHVQLDWTHPQWKKLNGLIGIQYFTQNNENNPGTGTTPFIPNYTTDRFSAFITESLERESHSFEFGLRYDFENSAVAGRETNQDIFRDRYDFSNLTISLGWVKSYNNLKVRTNIGTAFRSPNLAELYSFGQTGFRSQFGLLRYQFNSEGRVSTSEVLELETSDVALERSYKWVNELEWKKNKSRLTLTPYFNFIENYIFSRPITITGTIRGPQPVFLEEQTNAAFAGADLTFSHSFNKSLSGTLGASYLWSRDISRNQNLINQVPANINYQLEYKTKSFWKFNSSKLSLQPSYTFTQFQAPRTITPEQIVNREVIINAESEIFDFADAPDGYFLVDLVWAYNAGRFSGNITIKNLLNQRYRDYLNQLRYFADDLGTNVLMTINYKFQTK